MESRWKAKKQDQVLCFSVLFSAIAGAMLLPFQIPVPRSTHGVLWIEFGTSERVSFISAFSHKPSLLKEALH